MAAKQTRISRKKKHRRLLKLLLGVFLIVLIAFVGKLGFSVHKALKAMQQPIAQSEKREQAVSIGSGDPFSVLLLGIDETADDAGRSDTMIVMTVNPQEKSIKMLSIPRDTRTAIAGYGTVEKINHAYARGGIKMSIATVEQFMDIPIDYYVSVNMDGFKKIIDALDGVTVNNDLDLTYKSYHFAKGKIAMNGKEALVFSRIRKQDPRGDFGRQLRQKQIIEAVLQKGTRFSSILKYEDVLESLGGSVKTNLSISEMFALQKQHKGIEQHIEQFQFKKFNGGYIGKYWYFFPDEAELDSYRQLFKQHLGLS